MKTSLAVAILVIFAFVASNSAIARKPVVLKTHPRKLRLAKGKLRPAPKFKMTSAVKLQHKLRKVSPFLIGKKILGTLVINEAYKSGQGVHVSAGHPLDEATHSQLTVTNVHWCNLTLKNLDENRDDFAIMQKLNINQYLKTATAAAVDFRQASNIDCLYLLSFGTSIKHNALLLRVQTKDIPRSKIYYNSAANEYFTFVRVAGRGKHRQISVWIATDKMPSPNSNLAYFHHVRLKYLKAK